MDNLREKVIKGLECCMSEKICNSPCPYKGQCDDSGYYFSKAIEDAIDLLKAQEIPDNGGWTSVKDGMPPEKETIFAKFKGTDQWNPAMFATSSEDVRVVVQFEDGTRKVWHDNTMDGKWKCEREKYAYPKRIVTHWMPNPELPKEET